MRGKPVLGGLSKREASVVLVAAVVVVIGVCWAIKIQREVDGRSRKISPGNSRLSTESHE
jgi:hypothetical protein